MAAPRPCGCAHDVSGCQDTELCHDMSSRPRRPTSTGAAKEVELSAVVKGERAPGRRRWCVPERENEKSSMMREQRAEES